MEYDHHPSDSPRATPPLKRKQHHHHCFTSCFRPDGGDQGEPIYGERAARPVTRSPTSWIRPEHRGKCLGKGCHCGGGRHRRRPSTEFTYDPLSYALNFDEGYEVESPTFAEQLRLRCFSSQLPASPSRKGSSTGGFDDPNRVRRVGGMDSRLRFS
ncbi:hypothetical protein OPV22_014351 [Ensete ventricosum]|uniref:DUF4005 domain-containing protein n=1 Tax=Ensete ventricosum TaxID=4639 RepID=A0AAV8R1E8_ENSVE|nr:hypothetical protein OPV22_014351 [Ensete ventricosum]RWW54337.1 hypothetical protein BHE74_00039100 [Ensete ventricosum]